MANEVKDNGANNQPVSGGSGMSKGSGIFFQNDIFDPMQPIFNIAMAANAIRANSTASTDKLLR